MMCWYDGSQWRSMYLVFSDEQLQMPAQSELKDNKPTL